MINIYTPLEKGLGDWIDGARPAFSLKEAEIVLIPGGSDWQPSLYGHTSLSSTCVHPASDVREMDLINDAVDAGKFIIGICKGAQGLTIRAGGWLIQDVSGHHGHHEVETHDGKKFTVNSSHHQMMYPYDLPEEDYKVLGWSEEISSRYITQGHKELSYEGDGYFKEPEVIWYPKIRGLAIQAHPEWQSMPAEFNAWLNNLILELI